MHDRQQSLLRVLRGAAIRPDADAAAVATRLGRGRVRSECSSMPLRCHRPRDAASLHVPTAVRAAAVAAASIAVAAAAIATSTTVAPTAVATASAIAATTVAPPAAAAVAAAAGVRLNVGRADDALLPRAEPERTQRVLSHGGGDPAAVSGADSGRKRQSAQSRRQLLSIIDHELAGSLHGLGVRLFRLVRQRLLHDSQQPVLRVSQRHGPDAGAHAASGSARLELWCVRLGGRQVPLRGFGASPRPGL